VNAIDIQVWSLIRGSLLPKMRRHRPVAVSRNLKRVLHCACCNGVISYTGKWNARVIVWVALHNTSKHVYAWLDGELTVGTRFAKD
jgi:hypothetical protein